MIKAKCFFSLTQFNTIIKKCRLNHKHFPQTVGTAFNFGLRLLEVASIMSFNSFSSDRSHSNLLSFQVVALSLMNMVELCPF